VQSAPKLPGRKAFLSSEVSGDVLGSIEPELIGDLGDRKGGGGEHLRY
jgi:hypothetical protein